MLFPLLALAATSATAQTSSSLRLASSILNITLSDGNNACEYQSPVSSCGPVYFGIQTNPVNTTRTCINLTIEEASRRGNETDPLPQLNYTIINSHLLSDDCQYSHLFYQQRSAWRVPIGGDPVLDRVATLDGTTGSLQVEAFGARDCVEVDGQGWYQWNCEDEAGSCEEMPFAVKSISVVNIPWGENGNETCAIAMQIGGEENAGGRPKSLTSLMTLVVGLVVVTLMM